MKKRLSNTLLSTAFVGISILLAASASQAQSPGSWIDAGVTTQGATYLFQGPSYLRFSNARLDAGYPRPLAGGGWQGLPAAFQTGIDAALFAADRAKTYFFKGNQYLRLTGVTVDPGYPLDLPGGWDGLPVEFHNGIDAALFSGGHIYFFKDGRYVRFTGSRIDPGYPLDLPGGWELPPDLRQVDAALSFGGKHYIFSGSDYIRLSGNRRDPGYPAPLPGGWAGLTLPGQAGTGGVPTVAPSGPATTPDQQPSQTTCLDPSPTTTLIVFVLVNGEESEDGEVEDRPFVGAVVKVERPDGVWLSAATGGHGSATFNLPAGGLHGVKVFADSAPLDLLTNCTKVVEFYLAPGSNPCAAAETEAANCWTQDLHEGLTNCQSAHHNAMAACIDDAARNQQKGLANDGDLEACQRWTIKRSENCTAEIHSIHSTCRDPIMTQAGCSSQYRYSTEP